MNTLTTIAAGVILTLATAALLAIGYLGITRDRGRREDEPGRGIRVNPDREPW